ncbi:hypothetical protein, partial [Aeromonas hydrophila]|uniref:hypothetical protein n=1 Tax=Aeromonas hydrophila TaxID=644 RepID=UPI0036DCCCE1
TPLLFVLTLCGCSPSPRWRSPDLLYVMRLWTPPFGNPACFAIALFAENVTDFKSAPAAIALRDMVPTRKTI